MTPEKVLGEITDEIRDEWGFYQQHEGKDILCVALRDVLAAKLKAGHYNAYLDSRTDADWQAEAEKILRGE